MALNSGERLPWIDVINGEYNLLVKNKALDPAKYVELEQMQLSSRIVHILKHVSDRQLERCRARILASDNFQDEPKQRINLYTHFCILRSPCRNFHFNVNQASLKVKYAVVKKTFSNVWVTAELRYVSQLLSYLDQATSEDNCSTCSSRC